MFIEILPYLFCVAIALFGTIVYRRLSRSTKTTKDKVAGITVAVTIIPVCFAVLVMVFEVNPNPDWPWVIIVALPVISNAAQHRILGKFTPMPYLMQY